MDVLRISLAATVVVVLTGLLWIIRHRRAKRGHRIGGQSMQYAVMSTAAERGRQRIPEYRVKFYCLIGLAISLLMLYAGGSQARQTLRTLQLVHNTGRSRRPVWEHFSWEDRPVGFVLYFGLDLLMLVVMGLITSALVWRLVRGRKAFA